MANDITTLVTGIDAAVKTAQKAKEDMDFACKEAERKTAIHAEATKLVRDLNTKLQEMLAGFGVPGSPSHYNP